MVGRAEVFRGVPVLGIVAAAHMSTRAAEAKMNPCIPHCQTLFATVGVRPGRSHGAQMPATRRHGEIGAAHRPYSMATAAGSGSEIMVQFRRPPCASRAGYSTSFMTSFQSFATDEGV